MHDLWNTGAEGWITHRALFDHEMAPFATAVVDAVAAAPGDRLLDVGCGTGAVLGLATGRGASGVGVDISVPMIAAARESLPDLSFVAADAQTTDLTPWGPFTGVVSRFGVMFFDDPVAAFANVRTAVAAGGRMAFVCWRGLDENPMFSLGTSVLVDRLDPPPEPPAPGAPGPTAFADPERVRTVLDAAGWDGVEVTPFDAVCDYSVEGSDGVEERLTMLLATTSGRSARRQLEPRLGPDGWAALLDEIRDELRRHAVGGSVRFTGATWLVTARNLG